MTFDLPRLKKDIKELEKKIKDIKRGVKGVVTSKYVAGADFPTHREYLAQPYFKQTQYLSHIQRALNRFKSAVTILYRLRTERKAKPHPLGRWKTDASQYYIGVDTQRIKYGGERKPTCWERFKRWFSNTIVSRSKKCSSKTKGCL